MAVVAGGSESESDALINQKIKKALAIGLMPIVCVGESLEEREAGITEVVIGRQIAEGFADLVPEDFKTLVVAYEPVWAIGTGKTATPDQAEATHAFIRSTIAASYGEETANALRIQYGGSVKPGNIKALMAQDNIDGALVGGASLVADSFAQLVTY